MGANVPDMTPGRATSPGSGFPGFAGTSLLSEELRAASADLGSVAASAVLNTPSRGGQRTSSDAVRNACDQKNARIGLARAATHCNAPCRGWSAPRRGRFLSAQPRQTPLVPLSRSMCICRSHGAPIARRPVPRHFQYFVRRSSSPRRALPAVRWQTWSERSLPPRLGLSVLLRRSSSTRTRASRYPFSGAVSPSLASAKRRGTWPRRRARRAGQREREREGTLPSGMSGWRRSLGRGSSQPLRQSTR